MAKPLPASIETKANFAHGRHRGFRVPNRYSAKHADELKTLGASERITVFNARLLDPAPTLESHGFALVTAPTTLNLLDTEIVRAAFYQECRRLLARITGSEDVRGGGHEYRNGFGGVAGPRGAKPTPNGSGGAYAQGIHADMCAAVERRFAGVVPDGRHFESINIWRSAVPETIEMMPLAVCDMASVRPEDIVFGDGQNTGNIRQYTKVVDQRLIHGPHQRWYYFPRMTPDEVLLFRQYDTRQEALNMRTVFHTAVADPTSPPNAPPRSTIEVRMQAIHGEETDRAARLARFLAEIPTHYADGRVCDWWSGPIEGYVPPPVSAQGESAAVLPKR